MLLIDQDAVVDDMSFNLPLRRYGDADLVLLADQALVAGDQYRSRASLKLGEPQQGARRSPPLRWTHPLPAIRDLAKGVASAAARRMAMGGRTMCVRGSSTAACLDAWRRDALWAEDCCAASGTSIAPRRWLWRAACRPGHSGPVAAKQRLVAAVRG